MPEHEKREAVSALEEMCDPASKYLSPLSVVCRLMPKGRPAFEPEIPPFVKGLWSSGTEEETPRPHSSKSDSAPAPTPHTEEQRTRHVAALRRELEYKHVGIKQYISGHGKGGVIRLLKLRSKIFDLVEPGLNIELKLPIEVLARAAGVEFRVEEVNICCRRSWRGGL